MQEIADATEERCNTISYRLRPDGLTR